MPLKQKSARAHKVKMFNYCVGRPWPDSESLSIYAHGSPAQYGSKEDAESFRKYVDVMTGRENFIYEIIPLGKVVDVRPRSKRKKPTPPT